MTLDELADAIRTVDGLQSIGPNTSKAAARAVLLEVADWLYHRNLSATADELRRIAGEVS